MNRFADYQGEPSSKPYHPTGCRTHKLNIAAHVSAYSFGSADKLHGALTDARICRHVWQWLDGRKAR